MLELDKKLTRILKDLDINNLVKLVRGKADSDDLTREMGLMDGKVMVFSDEMQKFRKDLDYIINLYKKIVN